MIALVFNVGTLNNLRYGAVKATTFQRAEEAAARISDEEKPVVVTGITWREDAENVTFYPPGIKKSSADLPNEKAPL